MRALLLILIAGCHAPQFGDLDGTVIIDGAADASGVRVRAVGPLTASAVSDGDGRYQLPGLPGGEYALTFDAEATLEAHQVLRLSVGTAPASVPEVRFTAVGSIEGTVRLAGSAGAGVVVFVDGASSVAASDAAGRYHLDLVPAGIRTVEAVLTGYQPGQLVNISVGRGMVAQAPVLDLAVDAAPPYPVAALAGTALRLDRSDHSGTQVTATRGATQLTTTTAADGSYHFDGLPTGIYQIDFAYDGRSESIPQVLALAGNTGQVVDGALYPLEPSPLTLPEARRLGHELYMVQILDGERALVAEVGGVDSNDETLELLSFADGTRTPVANDVNRNGYILVAKSGGRALYLAGVNNYGGALRSVATDGTPPVTLADLSDSYGYQLTHDEKTVLYTVHQQLFSIPATGGTPQLLASGLTDQVLLFPDDKRVAYQACTAMDVCQVSVRKIDGSDTPLDLFDASLNAPYSLSPDGAWVLHAVNWNYNLGAGQMWLAATDGSGRHMVWDGLLQPYVTWAPDGRHATFFTDVGDLRLVDVGASGLATLAAENVQSAVTFSADGTRLLYLVSPMPNWQFWDFMQQPAGGGTAIQLGTRVAGYVLPTDGTRTLFLDGIDAASRMGALQLADAAGTVTHIADGVFLGMQIQGTHVFYQTEAPGRFDLKQLWTVPLAGGTPLALGLVTGTVVASPSGAQAAWVDTEQKTTVAPSAGGPTHALGSGYPSWASDSRLVLTVSQVKPPYRHQNGLYVWEVTP